MGPRHWAPWTETALFISLTRPMDGTVPWTESVLHKFQGQPDGAVPVCSLVFSSGDLFGTTEEGGAHDMGTVFQVRCRASWARKGAGALQLWKRCG